MRFDRPVFLVGPMGAGKTTIGRRLAQSINGSFLDHDDYIIEQAHMSIPDIFASKGEPYFRELEHDCLRSLLDESFCPEHIVRPTQLPAVIAGGGGVAGREDSRALIAAHSLCLYLHLDVEHQYERVRHDQNRPMIHVQDIRGRLSELFAQRDPLYRSIALAVIDTDDSIDNIVQRCLQALSPHQL